MKAEIGYYSVNGVMYSSKILAILEAQKTSAEVTWHFFDEVLNKVNWQDEPETSLDDFYRMRALQIREEYDYVIVFCSGGADSTNVVKSFLENGIHVDEVIASAPLSGLSNYEWNNKDTSTANTVSETKFAQMPLMHEISTNYPTVKTTILDSFKDIIDPKTDEWLLDCQGDIINSWTHTHGRLDSFKHLIDLAENGKRIAVVMGIDKPVLVMMPNGDIISVIGDIPVNLPKPPFKREYPNVDRVLFYWTADMPLMMVKQSHVIARELHKPENARSFNAMKDFSYLNKRRQEKVLTVEQAIQKMLPRYRQETSATYNPFSVYQRGIVPFIYPKTYKPDLFQADKIDPTHTFFARNHDWFHKLHGNTRANQLMESDFKIFYNSINPKYLNNSLTGFKTYVKSFFIGNSSKFKPGLQ
jgi:hypothetical protein